MPYAVYKLLHCVGLAGLVAGLAAIALHAALGGNKGANPHRALVAALHGGGLLLMLLSGFGMLAGLDLGGAAFPGWIVGKLVVWLVLGAAVAVPYRRPSAAPAVLVLVPLLVGLSAYFAIYKPF